MMTKHFKTYSRADVLFHTKIRRFVTRVGERVQVCNPGEDIQQALARSTCKFVLFGIPEDLGVRANMGLGGTDTAWLPFLSAFTNLQSNDYFTGEDILLLGHFDFNNLRFLIEEKALDNEEKTDAYRHAVVTIDDEVEQLVKLITSYKKIPIAIGGGHNNAYPLIKGAAKGWHKAGDLPLAQLNVINLDAHTDLRPIEGRHSGNGFKYAEEDGYLLKYCIVGVQETHLPQTVLIDISNNPFTDFVSYEDIFVHEKRTFRQAVAHAVDFAGDMLTGIELDLDCIENTLTSASSPSGVTSSHARQYVSYLSAACTPAYLHICEGASVLEDGQRSELTGKLISYLVADFVKGGG